MATQEIEPMDKEEDQPEDEDQPELDPILELTQYLQKKFDVAHGTAISHFATLIRNEFERIKKLDGWNTAWVQSFLEQLRKWFGHYRFWGLNDTELEEVIVLHAQLACMVSYYNGRDAVKNEHVI
jgi:hypothetical protein